MPTPPEQYEELVEKLFDDRITDTELQALNDVLRRSPEARDHYWHLVMLEGHLADLPGWIAGQQYATQLAFSETLEAFIEMESNAEAQLQTYPSDSIDIETHRHANEPITWQDVRLVGSYCMRTLVRQRATWGVAAAAVICIVGLIYATWFAGSSTPTPSQPLADSDQPTPEIQTIEPAPFAVVMNQTISPSDPTEHRFTLGQELSQGQVIALAKDSAVELEYRSGAAVILQGPGEFELHSPERVGMAHGRVNAFVPPQAKGFTVSTAQTDFIDHGTEFVVAVDQEGRGEVVVLDGLIEARPATDETLPSQGQAKSIMLHEGFGGRIVPDKAMPASVQPIDASQYERHTRKWDDVIYRPHLSGEISYATSPPASLEFGKASTENPILIPEQRGVTLAEGLHLNSNKANGALLKKQRIQITPGEDYVIPAGTELNSFLIHFDISEQGFEGPIERNFKLRFNGRIVGIVEVSKYQNDTDEVFGLDSILYPGIGTLRGAADPPEHPNYDHLYISDDLRTLSVKMRLSGMDQIRVLVENTDQ